VGGDSSKDVVAKYIFGEVKVCSSCKCLPRITRYNLLIIALNIVVWLLRFLAGTNVVICIDIWGIGMAE